MNFTNISTLIADVGYFIGICAAIFAFIVAIQQRRVVKIPVIITAVIVCIIAIAIALAATFLPNSNNQTILPPVTATPSTVTSTSTSTTTVTPVPSATPTHPNPTATSFNQNPTAIPTPRLTPTSTIKTPVPTPVICQAPCDAEFPDTGVPFTINGPAIVEWADPGCGIYELNAGNTFTWSSDGHYWLYSNQASLDSNWPGHLNAYQSKSGNQSCKVGPPP